MSFDAVDRLRQRGWRARRLENGLPEWRAAGLPVVAAANAENGKAGRT
jgi:ArsR family transcriptional regulator